MSMLRLLQKHGKAILAAATAVGTLIVVSPSQADVFAGKVVEVVDGDTVRVGWQSRLVTVRLQGIDAPELRQPYGLKAKEFVTELAMGQVVMVGVVSHDKTGTAVGEVVFKDGRSLSREVIRAGFAWWDRKEVDDPSFAILMSQAKRAKRGLWADPNPVAPCVFRLIH